jgi:hypothetical protein
MELALSHYGNTVRGLCHCGQPVRTKGKSPTGKQIWDKLCWLHRSHRKGNYRAHKKDYCEACGFVAIVAAQLDVDHIDGDRTNNDIDNLQTLCANCHRLKTHTNKDHLRGRDGKVS